MTKLAKVIVRGLLGLMLGILSGGVIGALGFALNVIVGAGNRSLGGMGTIANPIEFSALIGALIGAVYGAFVGAVNGLVGPGSVRGAAAGGATGFVISVYVLLSSRDANVGSALFWIVTIGVILGLATGTELKLLTKRIKWLSK